MNSNGHDCTSRSTFDEWIADFAEIDIEPKHEQPQENQLDLFDDQTA
jgi:hypothetical protein